MHYKEIASRITGFSIPIFGVSWEPSEPEITVARRIIAFFEDRRVLYNDYALEVLEHCVESVMMIREFLTDTLQGLQNQEDLAEHLRVMRAACREFLDDVQEGQRQLIIRSSFDGGPRSWKFFTSLGKLRSDIGLRLGVLAVMYGLDVEDDLARILPPSRDNV